MRFFFWFIVITIPYNAHMTAADACSDVHPAGNGSSLPVFMIQIHWFVPETKIIIIKKYIYLEITEFRSNK